MSTFKAILLIIFSPFVLLVTFTALALIVWYKPNLIINNTTVTWAYEQWGRKYLSLEWKDLNIDVSSKSFDKKHVSLQIYDLCIDYKILTGCIEKIDLISHIKFSWFGIKYFELPKFRLLSHKLTIHPPEKPSTQDKPDAFLNTQSIAEYLETIDHLSPSALVGDIVIDIAQLEFNHPSLDFTSHLSIASKDSLHHQRGPKLIVKSSMVDSENNRLTTELIWQRQNIQDERSWLLTAHHNIHSTFLNGNVVKGNIAWSINRSRNYFSTIYTHLNIKSLNFLPSEVTSYHHINFFEEFFEWTPQIDFKGHLNSAVIQASGFSLNECLVHIPYEKEQKIQLNCLGVIQGLKNHSTSQLSKIKIDSFPSRIDFELNANLNSNLLYEPQKPGFYQTSLIEAELNIADIQYIYKILEGFDWQVPTPFNELSGPLKIIINEPIFIENKERLQFPVHIESNLEAHQQRLELSSQNRIDFNPQNLREKWNLHSLIFLKDFRIELPPFDPFGGIPRLTPDSRFQSPSQDKPVQENQFKKALNYHIEVKTQNPIQLFSNLAKPYIPIDLDLLLSNDLNITGQIDLRTFELGYLRRSAVVERLNLKIPTDKDAPMDIDGRVRVDVDIYKVYIDIYGNLEAPQIDLLSDPVLPRNEVISLLIFNRPLQTLDESEEESVGGMSAALADQAIGLFGIWALASTPVQSLSYNPATQTYSASLQVTEGTSLSIGGDWESIQNFQLRRRLAQNWIVSTLVRPTPTERARGEFFLEWQRRY